MKRFFARPYAYAVTFSAALTLLFAWSLLAVFVIPREFEQQGDGFETVDLSRFTTAAPESPVEPETKPVFILTLPAEEDPPAEPTETRRDTAPESESATEPPIEYPIITENSYLDEHISITIETIRRYGSDFHVAEIRLDSPQYLKTALAKDTFGLNITERTSEQARRVGAILAVNGDYYPYRLEKKNTVGNILRDYKVLYNMDMKKTPGFPPLDTLALHDDGSISVYGAKEITADELAARGDVHDALSFGPYMARDGILRVYNGKNASLQEPRCAIGMVEPGHYIIIDCEGRVPNGPKGMTINQIGMLLYANGCNESFLLDGGSTSVLIFMGEKLNRTGKDTSIGSPRNQHELFGIGYSEMVHTDWFNGKPKK